MPVTVISAPNTLKDHFRGLNQRATRAPVCLLKDPINTQKSCRWSCCRWMPPFHRMAPLGPGAEKRFPAAPGRHLLRHRSIGGSLRFVLAHCWFGLDCCAGLTMVGGRYCEPEGPSAPGGVGASAAGRLAQHAPHAHAVNCADLYTTKPARQAGQKRNTARTDELTSAVTTVPRLASGRHSDASNAHGSEPSR